jgi:superfamily II DNA or RNA helicase
MQTTLALNLEKDAEQQLHLKAWKKNNYKGTSIAATGLGKTRIGLLAIAATLRLFGKSSRALVIVPTENLRDNEWLDEVAKWNMSDVLDQIEFVCIQTAYKFTAQNWDIVVIDEVHTTLSLEYRNFYKNNTWKKIYCFTATIPENEEYKEFLTKIAPIVYTTDLRKANRLGLVADHIVYNLGVSFSPIEALQYKHVEKTYKQAEEELGGKFVAFMNATRWKNSRDRDKAKWANIFYGAMQKRKQLCYNAANKIEVSKQILARYPDRKALVFSESIAFADKLQNTLQQECVTFHSKLGIKAKRQALESFSDDTSPIRVISSVKALNAGFNVPDCSLGICAAGSSKALDNIQRKGRTLRKTEDEFKTAIYINIFVKGSQELKWVRKRTEKDHSVKWIASIDEMIY